MHRQSSRSDVPSGDRQSARLALMAHPLVREYRLADRMLERLLAAETRTQLTGSEVGR